MAQEFEGRRARLQAVAYRMLGSAAEAEDAVQEAWLRLNRSDAGRIDDLDAWLTTVVARVALDLLKARNRRREDYLGSWLPEPLVAADGASPDPEHEALLADAVGLALMVVLDTLPPRERLAFVLHDMFSVPFADIAAILDATPEATRQLASRARRRVRGGAPAPDANVARQREVVDAFLRAAREGDFDALVALLHPDVVFRHDTGGRRAVEPVVGAEAVARNALQSGGAFAQRAEPTTVNGGAGVMVVAGDRVIGVAAMTIAEGAIVEVDLVTDPEKLRAVNARRAADRRGV